MQDRGFLEELNKFRIKTYYASIMLLDFSTERPITMLEGRVVNGSMSLAANSPTRRTGSLQIVFDNHTFDLTDMDNLIAINKKFILNLGIKNPFYDIGQYRDYGDVLWFKQGVFIITGANLSVSTNSRTINVQFIDKMGMLNGVCGGTLPQTVSLHDRIEIDPNENVTTTFPRIKQIVQEVVHHFGGEDPSKIIISDIPDFGRQVATWAGSMPVWFATNAGAFVVSNTAPQGFPVQYILGDDIGYMSTELTYPGELVMKAGSTVTGILDEIVKTLGNFEYFYDVDGYFHFQQIQNFNKTGQAPLITGNTRSNTPFNISTDPATETAFRSQYLPNYQSDQFLNEFASDDLITQASFNPKYGDIKNDFVVWGSRKANKDEERLVRYHLAIDERPKDDNTSTLWVLSQTYNAGSIVRNGNQLYRALIYVPANTQITNTTYWTTEVIGNISISLCRRWIWIVREIETKKIKRYVAITHIGVPTVNESSLQPDEEVIFHSPSLATLSGSSGFDWREELYRRAVLAYNTSTRGSYYDEELMAEWRKIFNPNDEANNPYNSGFKKDWDEYFGGTVQWNGYNVDVIRKPQNITYWLDLIDTNTGLGAYSVNRIGRRSIVKDNNKINEVLNREIPDIVFIDGTLPDAEVAAAMNENIEIGQKYCVVQLNYLPYFALRNSFGSCYEEIRDLLHIHLMYNAQVSLTSVPILYLDVNKVIRLNFPELGIVGNYIINQISWNLGNMATMQLQTNEAVVIT